MSRDPDSPTIRVRAATPEDVERLVGFQCAMARETEDKELDRALVSAGVRGVFEDPSRGRYWIAEREGRALGGLLLTFEWSDWRAATFWWIQSVFVEEAARGTGVFRALYDHVLGAARADDGVCGVRLYVDHDNTRAQAVYEAIGMDASHYRFYEVDFVLGGG